MALNKRLTASPARFTGNLCLFSDNGIMDNEKEDWPDSMIDQENTYDYFDCEATWEMTEYRKHSRINRLIEF